MLRGSVSVFIKETATGDDMTVGAQTTDHNGDPSKAKNWQQIAQEICEDLVTKKPKKPERASFGKKIVTIGKLKTQMRHRSNFLHF